jgi:hypothetical protein
VTFHNLLALHNTLVKNDDSESTKGVHITLSTRSNCLLRLKDLVGGAGSGKGLSAFPSANSRMDESSDDSGEAEVESNDSSPDGEELDEMVEEDDDEEIEDDIEEDAEDAEDAEDDVDMARSLNEEESIASQTFAEAAVEEAVRSELDTPTANEDADAVEEADFINYTNEVDDDNVDGVHLGPDGVADLPTPHADVGDEFEFANAEDNLIDGLAADEAKLDQVDDLDLLEDVNDAGDIVSHGQESAAVEATSQEEQQQENHEDEFLDLSGDIDNTVASAATLEAGNNEPSLDTSATATLDNDEIDYEDSHPNGAKTETTLDTGADEIDWDVEIKNTAPADTSATSPTASGKRTREVDEASDALLDDLPGEPPLKRRAIATFIKDGSSVNSSFVDVKRVRTGDTP